MRRGREIGGGDGGDGGMGSRGGDRRWRWVVEEEIGGGGVRR